jgi:hypothetical protein
LESACEIKLELVLFHNKVEAGKIEIKDIKENIGRVDGTFGIKAERDRENNKIIWTLRHDENTKVISSPDFLSYTSSQHGSLAEEGLIEEVGNEAFFGEFDVRNENGEESTGHYEWRVQLKVYGTKISMNNLENRKANLCNLRGFKGVSPYESKKSYIIDSHWRFEYSFCPFYSSIIFPDTKIH